ncbi:MAG: undecaprenyl-diphosphate phosphatase [Clostridia bacterium]|nr:undecaprenyl-diphosphate phosphatase [Clostridia bacterium]
MRTLIEFLRAALFGIVEGVTEWLPVSSTGHMILLQKLLPFRDVSENFYSLFEVVIQLGAILAVVILLWKKIWPFARGRSGGIRLRMPVIMLWLKVIVACLPLPVIKVLDLDERIPGDSLPAIAAALIAVGVLFLVVEAVRDGKKAKTRKLSDITFLQAFIIGLCQAVAAVFPGTSRSGACVIGALLLGLSRGTAVEFTFILAIPAMLGASAYSVMKTGFSLPMNELLLVGAGVLVAFAVSMLVIRPLIRYIKHHTFRPFGIYRILLGLALLAVHFFVK